MGCIVIVLEGIMGLWGMVCFSWLSITAVVVGAVIIAVGIVYGWVEM